MSTWIGNPAIQTALTPEVLRFCKIVSESPTALAHRGSQRLLRIQVADAPPWIRSRAAQRSARGHALRPGFPQGWARSSARRVDGASRPESRSCLPAVNGIQKRPTQPSKNCCAKRACVCSGILAALPRPQSMCAHDNAVGIVRSTCR
jgi:hypothetical protein